MRGPVLGEQVNQDAGYWDHSLWESRKRQGDQAIKGLINSGLRNTTVTVVLIGAQTAQRRWVKYEIEKSFQRSNGLIGIYIHKLKDREGYADYKGRNPFDGFCITMNSRKRYLSDIYPVYDWVDDGGYRNFGRWVEMAARAAGH